MESAPHLVDDLEQTLTIGLARGQVPPELLKRSTLVELLRYAAEEWGGLILLWLILPQIPSYFYPFWALLAAGRWHALGVILHDAAHLPLRDKPFVARILEWLAGYPLATTLNAMRYHHLRHHRDSGMPSDPYFKAGLEESPWMRIPQTLRGLLLIPFWTIRPWVGLMALIWPKLRNGYGRIFLQDRSGRDLTDSRELIDCARAELGQWLFSLGWMAAFILWPWPLLLGYLIPVVLSGVLAAWRLLQEHTYMPTTDRRFETILATTRDHHLSPLSQIILAPRNIGYHIVHHLHPQVGLAHLPAVRRWYFTQFPSQYPDQKGP